jgi:LysR family glycine cleavage system transcriptional activator
MNWIEFPPLNALRAFLTLYQTGTMALAGAALNVSHAAVSQQVKALESHLGLTLLDRTGRRVEFTPQGVQLAQVLEQSFGAIEAKIGDLTRQEDDRPLQISATSSFASNWLLPRLTDFRMRHPEVNLMINPTAEIQKLEPGGIDAALRYCDGNQPDLEAHLIVASPIVVVAAPELVGDGPVTRETLNRMPWVQELGTNEATDYLASQGVGQDARVGLTSLPGNMVIEAARTGQAAAVVARAIVLPEINSGRLRVLHQDTQGKGYYLVTRPGPQRDALRVFSRWIRRQGKAFSEIGE